MINTEYFKLIDEYGDSARAILKAKGFDDNRINLIYQHYEENKQYAAKLAEVYKSVYDMNDENN